MTMEQEMPSIEECKELIRNAMREDGYSESVEPRKPGTPGFVSMAQEYIEDLWARRFTQEHQVDKYDDAVTVQRRRADLQVIIGN